MLKAGPVKTENAVQKLITPRKLLGAAALCVLAAGLYWIETTQLAGFGADWNETFYPATMLLLHGQNPYGISLLHNPVWVLLPLIPFALLGEGAGMASIFVVSFFAYALVAYRFRASPVALVAFLVSPMVLHGLYLGGVDWLVILGFLLPPWLGLFLVTLKPQIGIAVVIYWLWTSYRLGGWRAILRNFLPVTVATGLTFLLFGNWLTGRNDVIGAYWNATLFPWSIPLGLALLYFAFKKWGDRAAVSASPFLSPYLGFESWAIAQLGFVDNNLITISITVGLWLIFALVRLNLY